MNKIFLIGNLTKDPELKSTPNGITVCTFTIAVDRRGWDKPGVEKAPDYFKIYVWRQNGENCAKYLSKGRKVAVSGELQPNTFVGNDGATHTTLEVNAEEVEFLSTQKKDSNQE